jgi:hypothetical protein
MDIIKEYSTKLDSKKRLTIRGSNYNHFHVYVFNNGKILLNPQVVIENDTISSKTLKMMEKSIENFKKGKVSKPIKLSKINFKE